MRATPCPYCGFEDERAGSIRIVDFETDIEGARWLLLPRPLAAPCPNCTELKDTFMGFMFTAFRMGLAIVCFPGAGEEVLADTRAQILSQAEFQDWGGEVIVSDDVGECQKVLRRRLAELANDVLLGLQVAQANGTLNEWLRDEAPKIARHQLAALQCIAPLMESLDESIDGDELRRQLDEHVGVIVVTRALQAAEQALQEETDPVEALDEAIAPGMIAGSAADRLMQLAIGEDAPGFAAQLACLILAWNAVESETTLDDEVAVRFATWMLSWYEEHAAGRAESPPCSAEFIRASMTPQQILAAVAARDPAERMHWMQVAVDAGILDADAFQAVRMSADGVDDIVEFARERPIDDLVGVLAICELQGWVDAAVQIYTERRDEIVGSADGAKITRVVVMTLWHNKRSIDALEAGEAFLDDSDASDPERIAPADRVALLNELGNVARYLMKKHLAASYYERAAEFIERSEQREDQEPILLRNMAIIMRERGRPAAARDMLLALLAQQPSPADRANTLDSISVCLTMLGEAEGALARLNEAIGVLEPVASMHHGLMAILLTHRAAARPPDDPASIEDCLRASAAAEADGDVYNQAAGTGVAALAALRQGDERAPELVETAVQQIARAMDRLVQSPLEAAGLMLLTARLAAATEDLAVLQEIIDMADGELDQWDVHALVADLLVKAGEFAAAEPEIVTAWGQLLRRLSRDQVSATDARVLRDAEPLLRATNVSALAAATADAAQTESCLRASELGASLMGGMLSWPPDRRTEATAWLSHPLAGIAEAAGADAAVIAAFTVGDTTELLIVRDGDVTLAGTVPSPQLSRARAELAAATSRGSPNGDPVARSPAWAGLASTLARLIGTRLNGSRNLVFVDAQALHGLPLHLVPVDGVTLCERWPCTYVASLLQLAGLRQRAAEPIARAPRATVIAVPRQGDRPRGVEAIERAATRWSRLAEAHGFVTHSLLGRAAERDAVLDAFAGSDLLFLACHGQSQPADGRHGLLVAARGQLPVISGSSRDAAGRDFLLSWDEIGSSSPRVVISAACSSGSRSFTAGGERVSLDRKMISAGTSVFFGPLWDVSLEHGQEMALELADRRLSGTGTWAEAWAETVANAKGEVPPATWQAFVLHGDWRVGLEHHD